MSRHTPDATRRITVEPHGAGPCWVAEKWGARYLFIGPQPGRFMFYSTEARNWDEAIKEARDRWRRMDSVRRNTWYGPHGRYTQFKG